MKRDDDSLSGCKRFREFAPNNRLMLRQLSEDSAVVPMI